MKGRVLIVLRTTEWYITAMTIVYWRIYYCLVLGTGRKPSPVNEQSSMVVETVEKQPGAKSLARFKGDAGRVSVRGPGLKKPMTGRLTSFTVDVKEAG